MGIKSKGGKWPRDRPFFLPRYKWGTLKKRVKRGIGAVSINRHG